MTGSGSRTPNVGRIYDALLSGKDNFAEDREAARRLIAAIPDVVAGARANREFLGRAVQFLAGEARRPAVPRYRRGTAHDGQLPRGGT